MHRRSAIPGRFCVAIALTLLLGAASAHALEQDQPFLMESWTLAPGGIFEILCVSEINDPRITWSLTKADGTFVQADRGPLFRERFVEAGNFLLRGEIATSENVPILQRTFAIHIVPGTPEAVTIPPGMSVATDPPFDATGNVSMGSNVQTLLMHVAPGTLQPSVDTDNTKDENGDGDGANDNDSRGTFFETDGTPLRVWFADGTPQRTLTVRGNATTGPFVQPIHLNGGTDSAQTDPSSQLPVESPNGLTMVRIEDHGNGTYAFSIEPAALSIEGRAILFYWDFGDGSRSMLDRPVHTFAQSGQYTIQLQARDLHSTQEVLRVSGILPVTVLPPPASSSSSESSAASLASSSSSEAPTAPATPSRFNFRTIGMIVGGLLLAILVGFGVVTIVGKAVQRRLDREPLKPANSKTAKQKQSSSGPSSLDQPPPMPVIDMPSPVQREDAPTTSTEESEQPKEFPDTTSKLSELSFKEEEAPSWLKQGYKEAEKLGQTVETAAPKPQEPAQTPASPPTQIEKEQRPLPPWLQPSPPPSPVETPQPAPPSPPPAAPPVSTPQAPPPTLSPFPSFLDEPVAPPPPTPSPDPALPPSSPAQSAPTPAVTSAAEPSPATPQSAAENPSAPPAPPTKEPASQPPPSPSSGETPPPPLPSSPPEPSSTAPAPPPPSQEPVETPASQDQPVPPAPSAPQPEPATSATTPVPAAANNDGVKKELSEAERERRRKKRARYRQNKKSREEVADKEPPQQPSLSQQQPARPALPKKTHPAPASLKQPTPETPAETQKQVPRPSAQKPSAVQQLDAAPASPQTEFAPHPTTEQKEESDEPIAIIRAENISQNQKDKKKS